MAYTEYLFDKTKIRKDLMKMKESLMHNKGRSDFTAHAAEVIGRRLQKDPRRYLDYGPYRPALKNVLIAEGAVSGVPIEPEIAAVYCGEDDEMTVMMAEAFRDFNLANYFLYTNTWMLDGDTCEMWGLSDPEFEL